MFHPFSLTQIILRRIYVLLVGILPRDAVSQRSCPLLQLSAPDLEQNQHQTGLAENERAWRADLLLNLIRTLCAKSYVQKETASAVSFFICLPRAAASNISPFFSRFLFPSCIWPCLLAGLFYA